LPGLGCSSLFDYFFVVEVNVVITEGVVEVFRDRGLLFDIRHFVDITFKIDAFADIGRKCFFSKLGPFAPAHTAHCRTAMQSASMEASKYAQYSNIVA